MQGWLARAAGVCVMVGWTFVSPAAESNPLTLRDAVALVVENNAELAAFAAQSTALREQAAQRALPPHFTIELQLENFAGSGVLSGTEALETTLQLSRIVEPGGKARLRQQSGDAELEQLTAGQRARRADVLAEVARRFIEVLAHQERLAAMQRSVALAEESEHAARSRVAAGAASPAQSSRAAIVLARVRIAREHAEHQLLGSRVALAVSWNEEVPRFAAVAGELFALAPPPSFENYRQSLDRNPELLAFASAHRVLEARTRLAEAEQRPNLTFNVGVRRLEAVDDGALVAGFAVPLGSRHRAGFELRAAQAERAMLVLDEQSRRRELHATLFGLYQELLHARTEAEALRERVRPEALRMLDTTQSGYAAGRFSFLELADAQRQVLEIELEAIDAAANFHRQLIEIERLTGQEVSP